MNSRNYVNLMHSEIRWTQYYLRDGNPSRAWKHYKRAWFYQGKATKELYDEIRSYVVSRFH